MVPAPCTLGLSRPFFRQRIEGRDPVHHGDWSLTSLPVDDKMKGKMAMKDENDKLQLLCRTFVIGVQGTGVGRIC